MSVAAAAPDPVAPAADALACAVQRLRLRMARRALWLAALARDGGAANDPLAAILDGRDDPAAERAFLASDPSARALGARLAALPAPAGAEGSPVARLAAAFRLTAAEAETLEATAALAAEPALIEAAAALHAPGLSGPRALTAPLLARLTGQPAAALWDPAGALARWRLVAAEPIAAGAPPALVADPLLPAWLAGDLRPDAALAGAARLLPPMEPLPGWPVEATAAALRRVARIGRPARLLVAGAAGAGRASFAAAAVERLGLSLLAIDAAALAAEDWPEAALRAARLAAAGGLAALWRNLEGRAPPTTRPALPLQVLALPPGGAAPPEPEGHATLAVRLPAPGRVERRALWLRHLPAAGAWPAAEIDALAGRHRLLPGDIAALTRLAPESAAEAGRLARARAAVAADAVATPLPTPFTWDDLVLPPATRAALAALADEARLGAALWEEEGPRRLMPRAPGLAALFWGSPGTGKTMAAQALAADLGRDLLRVDLARLVSKWIGETAKNLSRVFAEAERAEAVLLFDEADALFARRTEVRDAHDRHANADTAHLLQLLEAWPSVALLATNRRADIDPAFARRLRAVIEFPRPGPQERALLWTHALADAGAPAAIGSAASELAATLDLSGAQIAAAALAALFAARAENVPIGPLHLLRGVERELAKEGRALSPREREKVLRHA